MIVIKLTNKEAREVNKLLDSHSSTPTLARAFYKFEAALKDQMRQADPVNG